MPFNPLAHPLLWVTPDRLFPNASTDSVPLAILAVDLLRPATIVELCVGDGVGYCALTQAVALLGLATRCTGIDTWAVTDDDEDERGFARLRDWHDERYGRFSRLLNVSPSREAARVEAGSVDLLHIANVRDGGSIRRLLADWLPKLSPRGVLLLDNTTDPLVARVWDDLRLLHPTFTLTHGDGGGLAAIGADAAAALAPLVGATAAEQAVLQEFFARIGPPSASAATRCFGAAFDTAAHRDTLRHVETTLADRDKAIRWLEAEVAELHRRRHSLEAVHESLTSQLDAIFASSAWKLLMRYRRLRTRLGIPDKQQAAPSSSGASARAATPEHDDGATDTSLATSGYGAVTLLPKPRLAEAEKALQLDPVATGRRTHDVICFSIIDWEFRYQRPQQLMSQFAAHGHRVFYISTSRFHSADQGAAPRVRLIKENVWEVQLTASAAIDVYGDPRPADVEQSLHASLAALRRDYHIGAAVSYVMIASWAQTALDARDAWHWPVLYDCMDEWENFPGIRPAVLRAERALVDHCDLLIVTAARLEQKWKDRGRPMVLARNGVDADFYAERCHPNTLLEGVPHPIVGYYGAIAEWFDIDLMTRIARERPQYHFVLLGGVFDVDTKALAALPNVSLLGQQPYQTMPQYAWHFDVCIIPFKVNPITDATDPVKLYEYLSAGKPVVSVAMEEVKPYHDLVYIANDAGQFLAHLDTAVAETDPALAGARRAFARQNSWTDRYTRVETALAAATPAVSIVIITYNNLGVTKLCLDSVLRNTDYPHIEVIVVDNASADGTPEWLRELEAQHPEVRIILNDENHGFPRANNQGLAVATGSHLVLLNNDTVVPPGWLTRLVAHLGDPDVGLVGPVTNFVGNEAKVEVAYRTWGEMEQFARDRAKRWDGQCADIHMLAMFCLAMRRDTFERLGPLDEQFGVGMFEDDDYARRAREAWLRVVCAADTFIHHIGQASFKTLIQQGEYDELFARNRRSYEQKWGVTWTPHKHAALRFQAHDLPRRALDVSAT